MKKQILVFVILFGFIQIVFSTDLIKGKIIFYRNYDPSANSPKVFANDTLVVNLKNNSFFVYECLPGEYDFRISKFQGTQLHLKVEEGETYYLRYGIRMRVFFGTPEFLLVDSISAYPAIHRRSMTVLDTKNTPLLRPKNRFGLNVNSGMGFTGFPMFTIGDVKDSKISFGGGYGLGLKYGREFKKHFDLALDLSYQMSELRQDFMNANVSFFRAFASITPSYILPINGGDVLRLKLGSGLDYYWGTTLLIEGSNVSGGFNDDWKYENSLGYHLSAISEFNFSAKWSVNFGLKLYNVDYDFKSGTNQSPTNNKLSHPNGSGIDMVYGIYYHF